MKTVQIGSLPPPYGGVATYCHETSKQLVKLGHEVTVVVDNLSLEAESQSVRDNYETIIYQQAVSGFSKITKILLVLKFFFWTLESFDKVVYHSILILRKQSGFNGLVNWCLKAAFISDIVRREGIDNIIAHHAGDRGLMALVIGRLLNIRSQVVLYGGSIFLEIEESEIKAQKVKWVLQNIDLFFTCAENARKRAIELGVDGENVVNLGVAVDETTFSPSRLSDRSPKKTGKFVVGFIGYLSPHRGLKQLIDGANLAKQTIPNLHILIAGYDPQGYWRELEQHCAKIGMLDSVEYLGELSRDEYFDFLASIQASAFLIQSRVTASLLGGLEAQACGIPVLTTGLGGMNEVVLDGETGIICGLSGDEICDGLLKLFDYYQKDKWDSKRIRGWALEFSWSNIANKIVESIEVRRPRSK